MQKTPMKVQRINKKFNQILVLINLQKFENLGLILNLRI